MAERQNRKNFKKTYPTTRGAKPYIKPPKPLTRSTNMLLEPTMSMRSFQILPSSREYIADDAGGDLRNAVINFQDYPEIESPTIPQSSVNSNIFNALNGNSRIINNLNNLNSQQMMDIANNNDDDVIKRQYNYLQNLDDATLRGALGVSQVPLNYASSFKPAYNFRINLSEDDKRKARIARLQKTDQRFAYDTNLGINSAAWDEPQNALAEAQKIVANGIKEYGFNVMMDKDGYLAYQVTSGNDQTWSTNLTRLRKWMKTGRFPEAGKKDIFGDAVSYASWAIPRRGGFGPLYTNKAWNVLISWHKLLNATKSYKPAYRNKTLGEAYVDMRDQSRQNLNKRIAKLKAKNVTPQALILRVQDGIKKAAQYQTDRLDAFLALYGR